ncbi:MAG: DUF6603 domain-containing protein [Pseudomonadota bacterium]
MAKAAIEIISIEFAHLLYPLKEKLDSANFIQFMTELGYKWTQSLPDFDEVISHITNLETALKGINFNQPFSDQIEKYYELFNSLKNVSSAIININTKFPSTTPPDIVSNIGKQIFDYLVCTYLEHFHSILYNFLIFLGGIEIDTVSLTDNFPSFQSRNINWNNIIEILENIPNRMREQYGWHSENNEFNGHFLLDQLEEIILSCNLPTGQYNLDTELAKKLYFKANQIIDPEVWALSKQLKIPLYEFSDIENGYTDAGFSLIAIPDNSEIDKKLKGIAISPYVNGEFISVFNLATNLQLCVSGDIKTGFAIKILPQKIEIESDIYGTSVGFDGRFKIELSHSSSDGKITIIGEPNKSRFDYSRLSTCLKLEYFNDGHELLLETVLSGASIVIRTDDSDGFIKKILPTDSINTYFDAAIGISSHGVYFRGSAALEIVLPMNIPLGPIIIENVYLYLKTDRRKLPVILAISFKGTLGPVSVSIKRIGIKFPLGFPEDGDGNFGNFNIDSSAFVPPLSAGLALNTGPITGAGYLEYDKDNKRYAGQLTLKFGEIGLTAIGLITTRMPDGSEGYSLLVSIGITFSPPVQLSFGFTLAGVGGLIGIHRTMLTDVLRERLRNGAMDSILFPEDPIANADRIISDLRSVFPPVEDRYVFGPMFRIGWGAENIVTADIGLFIELPGPEQLIILGKFVARLPKPDPANTDNEKIVIRIDVLGVVDFDKQTLAIDASLVNSRILKYTLSGDAALRLSWGNDPYLMLSIGGFHPNFSPPPNFPSLKRLTLDISRNKDLQITCRAYFALTPNTLQFGAGISLYADYKATLEGRLSFNALIYFNPFAFTVDMSGHMAIKYKGRKLAGVGLDFTLSGPTPWHARGKASFEIAWWDVSVSFNETWGDDKTPAVPSVDAWIPLSDALKRPENWAGKLPEGLEMVESLTSLDAGQLPDSGVDQPANSGDNSSAANANNKEEKLLVHPAGRLEITQTVLPLGINLERLGNATITGATYFDIKSVSINGVTDGWDLKPVDDFFARGNFINLSKNDRLKKPSFEKMKAGVTVGEDRVTFVKPVTASITYESILINKEWVTEKPFKEGAGQGIGRMMMMPWNVMRKQLKQSAPAMNGPRAQGKQRFVTPGMGKRVSAVKENFAIVSTADMKLAENVLGNHTGLSRMEAEDILADYRENNKDAIPVQIVPVYEVAA